MQLTEAAPRARVTYANCSWTSCTPSLSNRHTAGPVTPPVPAAPVVPPLPPAAPAIPPPPLAPATPLPPRPAARRAAGSGHACSRRARGPCDAGSRRARRPRNAGSRRASPPGAADPTGRRDRAANPARAAATRRGDIDAGVRWRGDAHVRQARQARVARTVRIAGATVRADATLRASPASGGERDGQKSADKNLRVHGSFRCTPRDRFRRLGAVLGGQVANLKTRADQRDARSSCDTAGVLALSRDGTRPQRHEIKRHRQSQIES